MKKIRFIPVLICMVISAVIFSGTAMADKPAYEARIGSTYYQTLEDAFIAAKYPDMYIITLLCDVTDISSTITVSGGCTLDMNGFDITGSCPVFHVTGDLTLVDLTDSGSSLTSTSGDCTVLSDSSYKQWNVNVISQTGAAIRNNGYEFRMFCGTAAGKTYGIYSKEGFSFYGGTITGGTAYYFSEANHAPSVYSGTKTVSEDGKTATVVGDENATAVYIHDLYHNSCYINCFTTLGDAIDYCKGTFTVNEVKLTLLHDVNLDKEHQDDPKVINQELIGPLTIDMEGHNITGSGTVIDNYLQSDLKVTNFSEKPSQIICGSDEVPAIINHGELTLENVTVSGGSCGVRQTKSTSIYCDVSPVLTLNNTSITCEKGSGIEYLSGTVNLITGTVSGTSYAASDADGNLWNSYALGENSGYLTNTDTEVTVGLKHALSITAGTGGSITADGSGNYVKGTPISISAIPDPGYTFSSWTCSGGGTFKDAASASTAFTMPGHAVTVTANFALSSGDDNVTYPISASAGMGGSISPNGNTSVADGENRAYTITANDGYEIQDVLVDGVSIGAASSYTFENVKKAHTITASFAEKKVANPFRDVNSDDWFYENVLYVYQNGLMNGTTSDTFRPNGGMTRGMFVTVLYRLSGDTGSYTSSFMDVPFDAWEEAAVAWAAQNGISGGVGNNRFAPENGITRQQLAVLLYHYAKYKGYDVSIGKDTNILSYQDALTSSDYAYPALQWACGAGIMAGDSGYLNPNSPATRAQVAAMLERFVEHAAG